MGNLSLCTSVWTFTGTAVVNLSSCESAQRCCERAFFDRESRAPCRDVRNGSTHVMCGSSDAVIGIRPQPPTVERRKSRSGIRRIFGPRPGIRAIFEPHPARTLVLRNASSSLQNEKSHRLSST